MARFCKQAGCKLANDRTPSTGTYCPECGYTLKSGTSPLRKVIVIVLLAGICLAVWRNWPKSENGHTPPPVVQPPPNPVVPPSNSSSLFAQAEQLADAVHYPSGLTTNQLAEALARSGKPEEVRDPRLLAAIIYRWVAKNLPYDVESLNPTSRAPQDPDQVLRLRKAVCEGYACLSESLLSHLQIEARIIHGLARTGEDCIGRNLSLKNDGHAWLAVKWDNQWHLLEPTWAAGNAGTGGFKANFTWEWFDTDPAIFIYSHIPEQDSMQLISPPLKKTDIENAAKVDPDFFRFFDISPVPLIAGTLTELPSRWPLKPGHKISARVKSLKGGATHRAQIASFPNGEAEIRFPSLPPDDYHLSLYASTANSNSLAFCARYILKQSSTAPATSFPTFFKAYHDLNAQLHEPIDGTLKAGTWQRFILEAPSGLTFGLQWEGETTIQYLTASSNKTRYEKRLLLRPGKLKLWKIEKRQMNGLAEFESK